MSHFVYDQTALSYPKVNDSPLPIGADPTHFIQDIDWNPTCQAIVDIRDVLLGGHFYGFTPQTVDPSPPGVSTYFWVRADGTLILHTAGGNVTFLSSGNSINTTGGLQGGGALTSNPSISIADIGTAGTYNRFTTNSKGQVISGALLAYLTQAYATLINNVTPMTQRSALSVDGTLLAFTDDGTNTVLGAPGLVPATRQVIAGTGLSGGGALSSNVTLSLPTVGPGAGTIGGGGNIIASLTLDALGRVTAATTATSGSALGTAGQKLIDIIPAGLRSSVNSTTPAVVSAFFFNPADYTLSGATATFVFRAVFATGNTTVTANVKLRDITAGVDICTLSTTNNTTEVKVEQALTVSSAGANTIANADHLYEVRIYVNSAPGSTDTCELYNAQMRIINTL